MNVFETVGIIYLCGLDVIILCGNLFVFILICVNPRLRNATGYLIGNLMFCDLLLGALIPLSVTTIVLGGWVFGELACTLAGFVLVVGGCASNWALCLVSVERYLAILYPFKYNDYVHYVKYVSLVLWSFILAHNAVMLHYDDGFVRLDDVFACGPNLRGYPLYAVILNVFDLLIPDAIIVYTYVYIHKEVRRHNKEIAVNTLRSTSTRGDVVLDEPPPSNEWKAALVIVAIVGVFNVCWLPLGAGALAYALDADMPYGLSASLLWIALTQAGVNPLIYTVLNRSYRKEIMRLVRCQMTIQREMSAVSL